MEYVYQVRQFYVKRLSLYNLRRYINNNVQSMNLNYDLRPRKTIGAVLFS